MISHRIPHDFLRAAVQNRSKINEPGPRTDVGDIPVPLTPRLVGSEVPPHHLSCTVLGWLVFQGGVFRWNGGGGVIVVGH